MESLRSVIGLSVSNGTHASFLRALIACAFALLAGISAHAESNGLPKKVDPQTIHPERELMITHPAVVDSPLAQYPQAWSFGALLEKLVGPENASECVRKWLQSWREPRHVGSDDVAPRPLVYEKVIRPWQIRDGYEISSGEAWMPNLAHAPFRLLAIVNRIDLCAPQIAGTMDEIRERWRKVGREQELLRLMSADAFDSHSRLAPLMTGYGFPMSPQQFAPAGEGRFIFGAIDSDGKPLAGGWTIIFEYHLGTSNSEGAREWAAAWHALGEIDPADPFFCVELERVTRRFTGTLGDPTGTVVNAGTATTGNAGEHLAQLRSSEAAFGPGREFRQFGLLNNTELAMEPLSLTPAPRFAKRHTAEDRRLTTFLHERDILIRSGVLQIPMDFMGGTALIPSDQPNFHWDTIGSHVSRDARRLFSLSTCNGCHAGETGCQTGLHVQPRAAGEEAKLSDFLRLDGKVLRIGDPDVPGMKVEYQEMKDRAAILAALLDSRDSTTLEALRPILRDRLQRTH